MPQILPTDSRANMYDSSVGSSPEARADRLLMLLGSADCCGYIGEKVSQLQHGLQAAELAQQVHADSEVVLAALFHDIGHLCLCEDTQERETYGVVGHEEVGARYLLDMGLSQRVADLVRGHVQAKRYLAAKEEGFQASLSEASQKTLSCQGGPMSEEEARIFEQDSTFHDKLLIRRCDDGAQLEGWQVPSLESYRKPLVEHLQRQE